MESEPIPLYDGEPLGARIIHPTPSSFLGGTSTSGGPLKLRSKRLGSRKQCEDINVCFCPNDAALRPEYAECPLQDISERGMSILFDHSLRVGVHGMIVYRTISHRPVHVGCEVRNCRDAGEGHFILGLRLDRRLNFEERRPMKLIPGVGVAPDIRARKLKDIGATATNEQ